MFSLAVLSIFCTDLNGIWTGYTVNKNGDRIDTTLQLTLDTAGKIAGKVYGDYKSNPVVEGSVEGGNVTFIVMASEQSGNQINDARVRYTGKFLNADEMELTRERISVSNAGNAGNSATTAAPGPRTVIKLKRLGSSKP